ncbi:MAG TPA: hypothetical protein VJZ27_12620 [Aggregatilineales bacterium]|nr:hypothetical protein [Aggregatilineales bacterium]
MDGSLLLAFTQKYRIEIKYSLISIIFLGGLVVVASTDAFASLNNTVQDFMDAMTDLGFIGIFLVALIGTSTVLIQVPYTIPLLTAAVNGSSLLQMMFLGIAAGLGSGLGEIVSYLLADKILARNPDLVRSNLLRWVSRMVTEHPRSIPMIIFVWAASILPDDTVMIPLAMIKYGIGKIAAPLFLGKMVHNLLIAFVFYQFTDWASAQVSGEVKADLALGILIVFIIIILYQVEKSKFIADNEMSDQSSVNANGDMVA